MKDLENIINTIPLLQTKGAYSITENNLRIHLPFAHQKEKIIHTLSNHPAINLEKHILSYKSKQPPHPNIKNIIAVASGKGGVGKSTCTYFLAHALKHMGANVGVLDADIYGPSQSLMFHLNTKPDITPEKKFIPFERNGISVMSIGVLSTTEKAVMWRGPMISQALLQLYSQTLWPELDYLLIDMPPGTGDIPLTLIQKMPLTAALLISQPHPLATLDVEKSQHLYNYLNIPILGTLMNMSHNQCPHCNKYLYEPKGNTQLNLPVDERFKDITPTAHAEFIDIAEKVLSNLIKLPIYAANPFDQFNIETH